MIYLVSSIQSWGYRHWTLHFEEKDSIQKILKSSLFKKGNYVNMSERMVLSANGKHISYNPHYSQ